MDKITCGGASRDGTSTQGVRVLIQIRPNAFSQRGGDTVVVERLAAGLQERGIAVTVDAQGSADPRSYDVVHLFNFALPELLREQAERAHRAGVPFVVTTLCEDVPSFHSQSWAHAKALVQYVQQGQQPAQWQELKDSWRQVKPANRFENEWVVRNAAALLVNGAGESAVLRRDYPGVQNVQIVPFGHEIQAQGRAEEFVRAHGVQDFVFSVGRIESRKNQLMLLKALEDSELTVVLASGGFTYQPEYDRAVRSFKRKGRTIILDKLSPEMLSAAYQACRVHALPSWYELPGLVSLEAAAYGKNVVLTDRGTTRDYFGTSGFYCEPYDADSIRNAVYAGYFAPPMRELQSIAAQFAWSRSVEATLAVYERFARPRTQETPTRSGGICVTQLAPAKPSDNVDQAIEQAEQAAREGRFADAERMLTTISTAASENPWFWRTRGAIALAQRKVSEAREYFTQGSRRVATDPRIVTGLGMCDMMDERWSSAHDLFARVLAQDPQQSIALKQLLECAYRLGTFEVLVPALERYVSLHPQEVEWRYCWAGALFKSYRIDRAEAEAREVLRQKPDHQPARDLLNQIAVSRAQQQWDSVPSFQSKPSPVAPGAVSPVATPAAAVPRFDAVDRKLVEVEEAKRARRYGDVERGCDEILRTPAIQDDQREKAQILLAEVSILQGRVAEARPMYDSILQLNPRSARALCGRATLMASEGRWSEAEMVFREASALAPEYDLPLTGLGMCASTQGRREEAWTLYAKALQLNCENTRALLGIIELGYALQRVSELEPFLRSYLDLHPADIDFVYAFAGCLFAQGKLAEAKSEVEKLMIFDPNHRHAIELRQMISDREVQPSRGALNG